MTVNTVYTCVAHTFRQSWSNHKEENACTGVAYRKAHAHLSLIPFPHRWKDVGGIIKASDHGYVNITASKGSCDVDMSLTPDGEKQPHLHSTVNLNIPQFDYKFHGKEAWIYNMLGSAVHGIVKKLVVSKVEAVILNITNVVLPNMIDNAPTSITVGGGKSTIQFGIKLEDFHEHASSPLSLSRYICLERWVEAIQASR